MRPGLIIEFIAFTTFVFFFRYVAVKRIPDWFEELELTIRKIYFTKLDPGLFRLKRFAVVPGLSIDEETQRIHFLLVHDRILTVTRVNSIGRLQSVNVWS